MNISYLKERSLLTERSIDKNQQTGGVQGQERPLPQLKTGIELRVDALTLTGKLPLSEFETIVNFCYLSFDDIPEWLKLRGIQCGRYYENQIKGVKHLHFAYSVSDSGSVDYRLSLPGKLLRSIEESEVHSFCRDMVAVGARATRLDIAADDYDKQISFEDVNSAGLAGNYKGFRDYDPRQPHRAGQRTSFTCYFGSVRSPKLLRFYDKSAESRGEIDAHRLELQLRSHFADEVFQSYAQIGLNEHPQKANDFLTEWLVAGYDFRDRSVNERIDRCPRLDWWQKFLDRLALKSSRRFSPKIRIDTLAQKVRWFNKSVAPTLAVIEFVRGDDDFQQELRASLDSARERWSEKHVNLCIVNSPYVIAA